MTPFTPLLVTSLYEVIIERIIMTPFTPLLVTSLYEVFIERMEHNDTLHTSACDLTV